MEGEADFFPAGDVHLLTHGRLERQRFVPTLGFPPELAREAHYHGDAVLCAFGPSRRFLLAYRAGLSSASWEPLHEIFGDALLELGDADAARYTANSFGLAAGGESVLVMPAGVSDRLLAQVREQA